MYSYMAYGLGIHSDLPLPEFMIAKVDSDVIISIKNPDDLPPEIKGEGSFVNMNYVSTTISIAMVGTFLVREGHEIIIYPTPGADMRIIRRYLTGTIMAILLYQRGFLVLHASTVNMNGGAIAFMGWSGAGKSSIAAALYTCGYNIISDDVCAVELADKSAKVYPAFPRLKLSVETAKAVGVDITSLIPIYLDNDRSYPLDDGFTQKPVELSKIFVLKEDPENGIDRLQRQDAVIELIRHSLPPRLGQPDTPEHFKMCVQLVKLVPIYQLRRSSAIQTLPDLARMVEKIVIESNI